MQAFVDRFRAKATKAAQAQARIKMLAKMEPIAAIVDGDVLPFHLPSPQKPLAAADPAHGECRRRLWRARRCCNSLSLTISEDDRIGLLGANGNGKSTFAKLVAGRLAAMTGRVRARGRSSTSAFSPSIRSTNSTRATTPYQCVAELMRGEPEAKIRARCAQIGFPNVKADTKVALLSGGEKARLLMGLASFNGPHLLILDEPTNHLDIDSRAALIEAINDYEGAVILVSHDRYLLDACADRLWLVGGGSVAAFDGDLDDYKRFVLDKARSEEPATSKSLADAKGLSRAPKSGTPLKKRIAALEEKIDKFRALVARVDEALAEPTIFVNEPATAAQLAKQRGELERALLDAEAEWLELAAAQ